MIQKNKKVASLPACHLFANHNTTLKTALEHRIIGTSFEEFLQINIAYPRTILLYSVNLKLENIAIFNSYENLNSSKCGG